MSEVWENERLDKSSSNLWGSSYINLDHGKEILNEVKNMDLF